MFAAGGGWGQPEDTDIIRLPSSLQSGAYQRPKAAPFSHKELKMDLAQGTWSYCPPPHEAQRPGIKLLYRWPSLRPSPWTYVAKCTKFRWCLPLITVFYGAAKPHHQHVPSILQNPGWEILLWTVSCSTQSFLYWKVWDGSNGPPKMCMS